MKSVVFGVALAAILGAAASVAGVAGLSGPIDPEFPLGAGSGFPGEAVSAQPSLALPFVPAMGARPDRRQAARQALATHNGNKSRAAAALGVTRKTFYAWLESP